MPATSLFRRGHLVQVGFHIQEAEIGIAVARRADLINAQVEVHVLNSVSKAMMDLPRVMKLAMKASMPK